MNHDEMVEKIASQTRLPRDDAHELLVATLGVLAERVTAKETRDLLAQLPKSLKTSIAIAPQPTSFTADEFVERVTTRTPGLDVANSHPRVRAVFSVLHDAVSAGEMRDIAEQLGDDYADLWTRPLPTPVRASTRTGPAGTDALGAVKARARSAGDAACMIGGVASGLAGEAFQGVRTIGTRVSTAITRTLRRAAATGARQVETVADAVEDAADAVEDAAGRTAARFDDRVRTG